MFTYKVFFQGKLIAGGVSRSIYADYLNVAGYRICEYADGKLVSLIQRG